MPVAIEETVLVPDSSAADSCTACRFEDLVMAIAVNTGHLQYPVDADLVLDALRIIGGRPSYGCCLPHDVDSSSRSSLGSRGYALADAFLSRCSERANHALLSEILQSHARRGLLREVEPGAYVPTNAAIGAWVVEDSPIDLVSFVSPAVMEAAKNPGLGGHYLEDVPPPLLGYDPLFPHRALDARFC